jgi:hypothetical protein
VLVGEGGLRSQRGAEEGDGGLAGPRARGVDGVRQSEAGWRASARAVAPPTRARLGAGSRSIHTGFSGSARRGEVMWRARRRCRLATQPLGPGCTCAAAAAQVDEDRARLARLRARHVQHVVHVVGVCRRARRQDRTKTGRSTRSARAVGEDSLGKGLQQSVVSARRRRREPAPRTARPRTARRLPSQRPSERVGGGGGGLGEVKQGRGFARRPFAALRASERARREASTRAAAMDEHALEVTDAVGARGEARGGAHGAQELGSCVRRGAKDQSACNPFSNLVPLAAQPRPLRLSLSRRASRYSSSMASRKQSLQSQCPAGLK